MQNHGGAAAERIIESSERAFVHELLVDWNNNGEFDHPLSSLGDYVESIDLDRSLSGSAPAEILLIEGSAAAELTIVLGGEHNGMSLTGVFSPYNTASPLYDTNPVGAEIVYRIGVETENGTIWYPQFVGNVRTITPMRAENTVEITALDRVELLRKPIQLPPWAMSDMHVAYGEIESQLVRSSWVIDNCLRLCDVGAGPKRPPFRYELTGEPANNAGPQFFLTGNGSYLPTLGWVDNPNASTFPAAGKPMYTATGPRHPDAPPTSPRPLALAAVGTPIDSNAPDVSPASFQGILRYWVADRDGMYPYATHYFGYTLNTNGPNGDLFLTVDQHTALEVMIGDGMTIYIDVHQGRIRTRWKNHRTQEEVSGSWVDIPTGLDNVDIFAMWDFTEESGTSCYIEAGSNTTGWQSNIADPPELDATPDQIAGRVTIGHALSMSDVFYANRNWHSSGVRKFEAWLPARYRAELSVGKNQFSHTPSHKPTEAWETITQVAAAEMGSVTWDEEGIFRFWDLDTIYAKQAQVVRTLSLDETSDLVITNNFDSVRNVYTVNANKRRAVGIVKLFDASDVNEFYVPGRSTRHFRIWLNDVLSPLPFFLQKYLSAPGFAFPEWTDGAIHGYCIQYLINNLWQEVVSRTGVDINVYFSLDGSLNVRIWNGWHEPIRLAEGLGDDSRPAFRIAGTKILEEPQTTVWSQGTGSILQYGARNLELSGDWYQDTVQSLSLIEELRRRTEVPIPSTDAISIAGDPRLQLGDTLALSDPAGLGEEVRIQILGINRVYDRDSGLTDTLTVEMVNPAGKPPVVDAGADADIEVGERFQRTGTYETFGAPSAVFRWEIVDGPSNIGDGTDSDGIAFTPKEPGVYVFRFTVQTAYGTASDTFELSVRQTVTQPNLPANPGEALWIGRTGGNWYNVGLGKPDDHYDYDWDEILDGFSDPERFYLNSAGDVVFRVKITEARTSDNTKYPRSELREFKPEQLGSSGRASWDGSTGRHYMKGRSRIMEVARKKPWVCFFQIHDDDSDLIRVQLEGDAGPDNLHIVLRYTDQSDDKEYKETVKSSYSLGEWVDWQIEVEDGTATVWLNGDEVWSSTGMGKPGCYFKAGAYAQSAVNNKTNTEDGDGNQWFVVEMEKGSFETWHTGYPEPTVPDFSGGDGDEDDPITVRRLYLTNTAAQDPVGYYGNYWDDATAAATPSQLSEDPAGVPTTRIRNETSSDEQYVLMGQWVSSPVTEAGALYGSWRIAAGYFENNSDADLYPVLGVWVTVGDTDEIRSGDFAINQAVNSYELPTSGRASEIWAGKGNGSAPVDFEPGDRIVVELGYRADNSSTSSYGATLHYGGTSPTDLKSGDTDFNRPAWIELEITGGGFGSGDVGEPDDDPPPTGDDGVQAAVVHGWGDPLPVSDEFDYTGVPDPDKWALPGLNWEGHNGNGRRRPERQTVADGKLIMTGLQNGDSGWMRHRYESQNGGRWEARVRSFPGAPSAGEPDNTSNGNDYHCLLLIWPEDDGLPNLRQRQGEYDFMELFEPGPDSLQAFIHYPHPGTEEVQQKHHELQGVDMSEWHNIALEYKRGSDGYVRGYIDGQMWFEDSGGANSVRRDIQDMPAGHLCIQIDNFDGLNQTPATMEVAWVRVYDID